MGNRKVYLFFLCSIVVKHYFVPREHLIDIRCKLL